jgi:AraC-like DNA-binding protein
MTVTSKALYSDPDRYLAMLLSAGGQATLTRAGAFKADLVRVRLDALEVLRSYTSAAHVARARALARVHFIFMPRPGSGHIWAGQSLRDGDLINPVPGQDFVVSVGDEAEWGCLSLEPTNLTRLSTALMGRDLGLSHAVRRFETGGSRAFARLQSAFNNVQHLTPATSTPATLHHWNDLLLRSLFDCLANSDLREDRTAIRRHALIMQRLHAVLDSFPDEPLELTDVCLAVGTTLRTLHICCQEFLGMGPARYLRLRRMHLARRALLDSESSRVSVTEIALRYGFWELGRFARYYRQMFGETPSATLHRDAERHDRFDVHLAAAGFTVPARSLVGSRTVP